MTRPNQIDVSIVIELPLEYPDYINLLGMTIQSAIGYICLDLKILISIYLISLIEQGSQMIAGIGLAQSCVLIFLIPIGYALNQSLNLQASQTRIQRGSTDSSRIRLTKRLLAIQIQLLWIILLILGIMLYISKPLIKIIFNSKDSIIDYAWDYLIFLLPAQILALNFDSIKNYLLAQEITYPFIIIHSIVTMMHVGLGYLFIIQLKMGLEGAGISILLSEILNSLGIICIILQQLIVFIIAGLNRTIFFQLKYLTRNDWRLIKKFITLSLPFLAHLFIYYLVFVLINMILSNQELTNCYYILLSQLFILGTLFFIEFKEFPKSLSLSVIALVGYEKQKGQLSRAQSYVITSSITYIIYSCIIFLIFSTFKDNIYQYVNFLSQDLYDWLLASVIVNGLQLTLAGSLKAIKKVKIVSYCTFLVYFILTLLLAIYNFDDVLIQKSFIIANTILTILFIIILYLSDWTSRYSQIPILQEPDRKKQIQVDIELEES